MTNRGNSATPQSPETQDKGVREELEQEMVSHQGDYRGAQSGAKTGGERSMHMGATDDEVVPITPPMAGPADLIGSKNENAQGNERGDTELGEEMVDPRDHLTPG